MSKMINIYYQFLPVTELVLSANQILRIKPGVDFSAKKIILLDDAQIIVEQGASLRSAIYFDSEESTVTMQENAVFGGTLYTSQHEHAVSKSSSYAHAINIALIEEILNEFAQKIALFGGEDGGLGAMYNEVSAAHGEVIGDITQNDE